MAFGVGVGAAAPASASPTTGPRIFRPAPSRTASGTGNLFYGGGPVQPAPAVYGVLWGSQWGSDPSGEAGILRSFFVGVGGSGWLGTVNQYCQGVGSTVCAESTNLTAGGAWFDSAASAPSHPTQSQLAAEAARAAAHFGNRSVNAQYIVATSHNHNSFGFGLEYCAYHSTTSAQGATIAYVYLPYITDAGASCGANFNGLGPNAGITIVAGHELAEAVTDPQPSSGWLDSSGAEIGDKCAWISSGQQGAASNIKLSTGTFPVQSLWSNDFNNGGGGCVISGPLGP
jgi:hypothetical protein